MNRGKKTARGKTGAEAFTPLLTLKGGEPASGAEVSRALTRRGLSPLQVRHTAGLFHTQQLTGPFDFTDVSIVSSVQVRDDDRGEEVDATHGLEGPRNKHTSLFYRHKRSAAKAVFRRSPKFLCVCHAVFIKANYCEGEIDFKILPSATASLKLQKIWKCRFILAAACK